MYYTVISSKNILPITEASFSHCTHSQFRKCEAFALRGGGLRIFLYLLSFIINHPIYVLDLSTNEWREYDLCCANQEQSKFHCDLVRECPHFDFIGPPFMIAEHLEIGSNGKPQRTHVSAMMHKSFYNGNDDVLGIRDYISVRIFKGFFFFVPRHTNELRHSRFKQDIYLSKFSNGLNVLVKIFQLLTSPEVRREFSFVFPESESTQQHSQVKMWIVPFVNPHSFLRWEMINFDFLSYHI